MAERECDGGFISTSLQKAALTGNVEMLVAALECTATNIDAVDADGCTALMIAASHGHAALVHALCDAGADVSPTNGDGLTAEQLAERAGHTACIERLHREAIRRQEVWSAIDAVFQAQGGQSKPKLPSTSIESMLKDDVMSKLLAEAGLPKGPAESPF